MLQHEKWVTLVDALAVAEFTRSFSQPLELAPHSLAVRYWLGNIYKCL